MSKEIGVLADTMDNVIKIKTPNTYRNYKVAPSNSNQTTQLSGNTFQTEFNLPSNIVFNPSTINLMFRQNQTTGTGTPVVSNLATHVYGIPCQYFPHINRVEIFNSQQKLLDLNYADVYSKCSALLNLQKYNLYNEGFGQASNRTAISDSAHGKDPFLFHNAGSFACDSIQVSRNAIYGAATATQADNQLPNIYYNVNLAQAYPDSFFSCNALLYTNQSLFIRITWNPINKIAFQVAVDGGAYTALPSNLAALIQNINLQMYVENDPRIIASVMKEQERNPLELIICDVGSQSFGVGGTGQKNIQVKISPGNGVNQRLYKFYSILVGNAANQILPSSNIDNLKYDALSVWVDSVNILNFDENFQDSILCIKNQHPNSLLNTGNLIKNLGMFCYVFSSDRVTDKYNDCKKLEGLDFLPFTDKTVNLQYNIPAANTDTFNLYTFCVIEKSLYMQNGMFSTSRLQ